MDITGLIGSITGVTGLAISIYSLIRASKTARKQNILQLSWKLQQFLTDWLGDIREAISQKDSKTFEDVKRKLEDFITYGRPGRSYEGELPLLLNELKDYKEFKVVVIKLESFQKRAVRAKEGMLSKLEEIIANHHNLSEEDYKRQTDEELGKVLDAYHAVMKELGRLLNA